MAVTGIGEELRRERTRQGLTLEAVCARTKIPIRSLEAIEAEGFDRLPGIVFTRNFVRLYALVLKLEPEGMISRLPRVDIDSAPLPDPPRRSGRGKWDPRLTAAIASVAFLCAAGLAGTGAWYYYIHYAHPFVITVAAAPAPKSSVLVKATVPATPVVPQVSAPVSAVANTEVAANPGTGGVDTGRPVQVILTARDVVWVQITADGHTAFEGTLRPNDTRTVAADAQVKILAGNAGGLDISLNGKALDPIGPRGQTRTVRLTAEGPQFGPQNPIASSPL